MNSSRFTTTMTRIRKATKRRLAKLAKEGRRSQVETLEIALEKMEREEKRAAGAVTSAA